jgi:hypothetical protein
MILNYYTVRHNLDPLLLQDAMAPVLTSPMAPQLLEPAAAAGTSSSHVPPSGDDSIAGAVNIG